MGLLDDAIRDHLDLKRRRGADPTEVEQAEREALGPVRRAPEPPADDLPVAGDETALYDDATPVGGPVVDGGPEAPPFDEPFTDQDLLAEDDDEWLEEEEHPPLTFEAPPAAPEAAAPRSPAAPVAEPEPAPAVPPPPAPAPSPEPHRAPTVGDETVEFHVEDALAAEESPTSEEDVLEETPGFLEDTPDHDRLWFEQRPPKDFDFDG